MSNMKSLCTSRFPWLTVTKAHLLVVLWRSRSEHSKDSQSFTQLHRASPVTVGVRALEGQGALEDVKFRPFPLETVQLPCSPTGCKQALVFSHQSSCVTSCRYHLTSEIHTLGISLCEQNDELQSKEIIRQIIALSPEESPATFYASLGYYNRH